MTYYLLNTIVGIIFFSCLGFLLYWTFCVWQGDVCFVLKDTNNAKFSIIDLKRDRLTISCNLILTNEGKQLGTIMDCFPRIYMPEEYFSAASVEAWLTMAEKPRQDGYWEAYILEPKESITVCIYITFVAKGQSILSDMEEFRGMPLDIIMQGVGRSDWFYTKERIKLSRETLRQELMHSVIEVNYNE